MNCKITINKWNKRENNRNPFSLVQYIYIRINTFKKIFHSASPLNIFIICIVANIYSYINIITVQIQLMKPIMEKRGNILAYEKLELVIPVMSGDVYLAKVRNGIIDTTNRGVITDEVFRASTEGFMKNDKDRVTFEGFDNDTHNLFYTNNPGKAEKIKAILKEN